jgi:ferrochelatase
MILLVNFGGPRSLEEIFPFLKTLLQDRDVIRTKLPSWAHNALFHRVAKKRAQTIAHDYQLIGGRSPIYFDTEEIAEKLREKLQLPVATFHRYLPSTHKASLKILEEAKANYIQVLPLFPQFSYATTGSIARFLAQNLCCKTQNRLRWIKSYAAHPAFIESYQRRLKDFLEQKQLSAKDTVLLFSAHGVPRSFICTGDIYQAECELSFQHIMKAFPHFTSRLSYQSKFGKGEWIRPYTDETCENISSWSQGKTNAVIVPLTFTSDHIETLFEIEQLYLPILQKNGLKAYRCPALNLESYWIDALAQITEEPHWSSTQMLIRNSAVSWCCKS